METNLTASVDCTNLTKDEFHQYSLVRGVTSIVCTIICCLAIVLLLPALYKAHRRGVQNVENQLRKRNLRLAFYLLVITFAYLIFYVVQFEHYSQYGKEDGMCVGTGYAIQALGLTHICSTFCVSLYIFDQVYYGGKGCCNPKLRYRNVACELISFALIAVASLAMSAIPFATHSYGETGPWCWIDDQCEDDSPGFYLQLFLWYIPCGFVATGNTLVIGLITWSIAYQRQVVSAPDLRNKLQSLLRGVVGFIVFQALYLSLIVAEGVCRAIVTTGHKNTGCWFVYALISPTSALFLTLAFYLYLYLGRHIHIVDWLTTLWGIAVNRWRHRQYDKRPRYSEYETAREALSVPGGGGDKRPRPSEYETAHVLPGGGEDRNYGAAEPSAIQ